MRAYKCAARSMRSDRRGAVAVSFVVHFPSGADAPCDTESRRLRRYIARVPRRAAGARSAAAELHAADRVARGGALPLRLGKWSVRQVVGHLIDTERVMGYRAFGIGRGEASRSGFDENVRRAAIQTTIGQGAAHEFARFATRTVGIRLAPETGIAGTPTEPVSARASPTSWRPCAITGAAAGAVRIEMYRCYGRMVMRALASPSRHPARARRLPPAAHSGRARAL